MATNNELIRVEHVSKVFDGGIKALDDCSLSVRQGEVVSIIGPSGSGKSTLLRCLNLLEMPTDGNVIVDGADITAEKVDLDKHRRKMGMVFQHFNLFPNMTVKRNITLAPVRLRLKSRAEADADAAKAALEESAETIGCEAVAVDRAVAKVSVVGAGLMNSPGMAVQMFEALAGVGINIQMISSSEIKLSAVIAEADADRAVAAVHEKYFGES